MRQVCSSLVGQIFLIKDRHCTAGSQIRGLHRPHAHRLGDTALHGIPRASLVQTCCKIHLASLLRAHFCLQGATVVDFAYHVHTDVGNQMFGAKVNGKAVHAGHALANAEVVEVLTYDGRPSKGTIARHQVSLESFGVEILPIVWTNSRSGTEMAVADLRVLS